MGVRVAEQLEALLVLAILQILPVASLSQIYLCLFSEISLPFLRYTSVFPPIYLCRLERNNLVSPGLFPLQN